MYMKESDFHLSIFPYKTLRLSNCGRFVIYVKYEMLSFNSKKKELNRGQLS